MSNNNTSQIEYLNWLSGQIAYYYLVISAPIGIPINLLSIVIFWRLMRNKNNMGFLGICQSIVDLTLLICFLVLIKSSPLIFTPSLASRSSASCAFLTYLRRFLIHASSWIPVLITFDRFTFIVYGHGSRFHFMKSKPKLIAIILVIFTIIAVVDVPNLFYYVSSEVCTADYGMIILSDLISITFRTYIPFALMLIFNVSVVRRILKNNRNIVKRNVLCGKEYQFTLAVISYDVYFIAINFPVSVYYVVKDGFLDQFASNPLLAAYFNLVDSILVSFAYYEQTYSIFIYLAFNKLYRQEFFHIVRKIFSVINSYLVSPTSSNSANNTVVPVVNHRH